MPLYIGSLEEYVSVCCFCGVALEVSEIAARFIGEMQDFETKTPPQPAALIFCSECLEKCRTYSNDSIQKAWYRMQQLEEK